MASTASKVTMQQGLGGQVPSIFKQLGAKKVEQFHSSDPNFYAQATNWSSWEMPINGKIELPFQDWYDDSLGWGFGPNSRGTTFEASETEVWEVSGKFLFVTGQEIAQKDLLRVLMGSARLEWETICRTDGKGRFVVVEGAFAEK